MMRPDTNAPMPAALTRAIEAACGRIAPAWPLDRQIAVNPFWGFIDRPLERTAAELAVLSGAHLLMPRAWYREQWRAQRITERHLATAIARTASPHHVADLVALLDGSAESAPPPRLALVTDAIDAGRDLGHAPSWSEYVVRHISQSCAACFDEGQAQWTPARDAGLYPLWRELGGHDSGPNFLMGLAGFREAVRRLPDDARVLIAEAVSELEIPAEAQERYFTALLCSVGGWAAVCAFRRWDARLTGRDDDQLVHLLAVRLAWELVLARLGDRTVLTPRWRDAIAAWTPAALPVSVGAQQDWVVHHALEIAYQEEVARALATTDPAAHRAEAPSAQVVCCIDVRSEVFRRALEQAAPSIQTLGFAGFFGLPIAYEPLGGVPRAQLPGLLAPAMVVADAGPHRATALDRATNAAGFAHAVKGLARTPGSAFSFVEAAGLGWVASLIRDGFALGRPSGDSLRGPASRTDGLRPELVRDTGSCEPVALAARIDLAAGSLRGMSLTADFAPLLVLLGHGATTENNPQAAGLHCGACGGQTGEVNARAAAALLNDPDVRDGLRTRGIYLAGTHVVPGLHDTTTDEVTLYDLERTPASHRAAVEALEAACRRAGLAARRERADALGLAGCPDAGLDDAVRRRGNDWSEVRPEWGLAGNAAFIVAPRERTRGIHLHGRSFLHEYRWAQDEEFSVLEAIMTAPMIVTHWINMQYYASTVDPLRYGSGNKVLHNVVGGRLGVMEGAGGDLRIGLAFQSVHDGTAWRHEPLRLSVFLEAPAAAIDAIIAKHSLLQDLVGHRWLFLHQIEPASGTVSQWTPTGWLPIESGRELPAPPSDEWLATARWLPSTP
jgi:uncharacterized protein YbcC (UPF0753/DUF2309 family)